MYDTIFYISHINTIGGIETFFYQLAKQFEDRNITIVCKTGDDKQIERLKKYVRVVKHEGNKIKCQKAFFNYNIDIIDYVEAKEYIQILHSDYKSMGIKLNKHPKINRYLAVSNQVAKGIKEVYGIECEVIYNPYQKEEPKRVLNLISATRLTTEKGKSRMIKLGEELNKAGIPYLWLIFTNDTNAIDNPNIVYMKPRLDILDYISNADYLVQLSDAEAYCYSIVESLSVNTPIITTNLPVLKELGVNETNSIILDFDMSNLDVDKIYNKTFNFKYDPPKNNWGKEITKSKSKYKEELKMKYLVEANENWKKYNLTKKEDGKIPEVGEQWEVDKERLNILLGDNKYKVAFVKVVKELDSNEVTKRLKKELATFEEVSIERCEELTKEINKETAKPTGKKKPTKK